MMNFRAGSQKKGRPVPHKDRLEDATPRGYFPGVAATTLAFAINSVLVGGWQENGSQA